MNRTSAATADEALLDRVQKDSFRFFADRFNPVNGLVCDSTEPDKPSSIAVVGFALSCYPVAVERGWMTRSEAIARTLAALRFFHDADQSGAAGGVGYKGFFYHFLDMQSGCRAWRSELSTIDTALLVAGMLTAARYFTGSAEAEREIGALARAIYERIDWRWAQNGGAAVSMGWTPERGFIRWRWIGYAEALILYALALGSPSHPVGPAAYAGWLAGYRWKRIYDFAHVYAGPLFIHQFSHIWIDFRRIADAYMAPRQIDYFENSRRATYVQYEYGRRNPKQFKDYHGKCWGWTASDGPGWQIRTVHERTRRFFGYRARGAPFGPDDGTVAPWASLASLPFAPELVVPTIRYLTDETLNPHHPFGFYASFNPTFHAKPGDPGWISQWHFGLNQGPIVLMIENYRNGLIWRLMRECEPIVRGLRRAGFRGGWLDRA
ncbi:MAG TPA: glucoamylase family protein [Rhodanobacteraceae bacterium]|nr:glucoamylase family protein [Rhodanobacteraceae bacterium]